MSDEQIERAARMLRLHLPAERAQEVAEAMAAGGVLADPEQVAELAEAHILAEDERDQLSDLLKAANERTRASQQAGIAAGHTIHDQQGEIRRLRSDWYTLTHLIGCIEDEPASEVMDRARALVAEYDQMKARIDDALTWIPEPGQPPWQWTPEKYEQHLQKIRRSLLAASPQEASSEAGEVPRG